MPAALSVDDLLRGFLAGDAASVAEVASWVRRAAGPFRRRLAFEWDDLLQQALTELTADLRAGRLREPAGFPGYVWRSVNHTCLDRLRRHRRWRFTPIADLELAAPNPSPFSFAARRETARLAKAVVGEMPAHCRELWTMILDGLSYQEMSDRLAVAAGTLRVRVLRCRQQAVARWREVTGGAPGRPIEVRGEKGEGHRR